MDSLMHDSPLVFAILGAEVLFWLLLVGGLAARYLARWTRLSRVLLLSVPLVDVALITLTAIDLANGATPNWSHALAAVYLGFTVGFGHSIITSMDAWFSHRFAGGPAPARRPKSGPAYIRRMWAEWLRALVAWSLAVPALLVMIAVSGWTVPTSIEAAFEGDLWSWVARITLVLVAWLVFGPVYALLFRWQTEESTEGSPTTADDPSTAHSRSVAP
ncbi:hypothetical protein MN032_11650 [Agromyces atrinae]|uniref:hypothetical protein n=1 Tax=Agromyces atrinae TaxID=592376 RepID=UPI001F567E5A|nr:hypothetical protein [Agromyces atrinae]MCI2958351.1 hypothetical protein [Agromyces atrinae]